LLLPQAEISDTLFALDESLLEAVPDNELRLMLKSAVYPAYDLAWQMEELLMDTPDLDKLSSCVALLRVRGGGSSGRWRRGRVPEGGRVAGIRGRAQGIGPLDTT
jgi:hypothetical protein